MEGIEAISSWSSGYTLHSVSLSSVSWSISNPARKAGRPEWDWSCQPSLERGGVQMIAGSKSTELAHEWRREFNEYVSAIEGGPLVSGLRRAGRGAARSSEGPGARPDEAEPVEERLSKLMRSEAEKSSPGSESGRGEGLRTEEACDSMFCGT